MKAQTEREVWLKEFCRLDDLCKDWLIKSWDLRDEDKKIAMLYYKKAKKERMMWTKRWKEIK